MKPHPIFSAFRRWSGVVDPEDVVNFLGAKAKRLYFNRMATADAPRGFVEPRLPEFNEEYFEWIDLLESVHQARETFVMFELGAGYGRWLVNAAAALRASHQLPYTFVGVEPEPTHFAWMVENLKANGVDLARCHLYEAAVAGQGGTAAFYGGRPSEWYGQALAPAQPFWRRLLSFRRKSTTSRVRTLALGPLLTPFPTVDLMDFDVQGAELEVLEAAADDLHRVRRIHVGTHGQAIEEGLHRLFHRLGWHNLHNFGCGKTCDTPYGPVTFQDGVQTWLNPERV